MRWISFILILLINFLLQFPKPRTYFYVSPHKWSGKDFPTTFPAARIQTHVRRVPPSTRDLYSGRYTDWATDEEVEWVLFSRSEIAKLSYFKNFYEVILGDSKLTSFSESLCASRTLRMMSSVKLWKLEINSFCFSISVRTPKTRARVAPTSSERFSNRSRRTVLEKEVL